jgi:hypothetical protein
VHRLTLTKGLEKIDRGIYDINKINLPRQTSNILRQDSNILRMSKDAREDMSK